MRGRQFLFIAMAALALPTPGKALAASVSGRASTVFEWFDDAKEETATPVYQYLRVNVKDIGESKLFFTGYGRLATDLQDRVDTDSRLYYGYLEKKGMLDNKLNARLGRQFIATTAGASMMDGLRCTFTDTNKERYQVTLFGGGDVAYYEDYNKEDLIAGGAVAGFFQDKKLELELSYVQKWDDSALSHELIGLDAKYRYEDIAEVYAETQFNYLSDSISYFLGGAKWFRHDNWGLRSEYLYSLPVFSSTSIYSVFAASKYQEFMLEYTRNIRQGLNAFARWQLEMYDEFDDANVFEAGAELIRTDKWSGYLSGIVRIDDDGQDLRGVKIHTAYMVLDKLQLGAGAHVDVLERRIEDTDETTSQRYWVDGTYDLTEKVDLETKIERVTSDLWDKYYRGIVRLNISF